MSTSQNSDSQNNWDEFDDEALLNIDIDSIQRTSSAIEKCGGDEHSTSQTEQGITSEPDYIPPIQRFRRGYLWVSDLSSQSWCEQQMVYNFTMPVEVVEKPVMTKGTNMHLARELEVQDIVRVNVTSDEDIFGIKVLNLLGVIESFLLGIPVRREIPIFGAPFDKDVFLIGMIDEIRCDPDTFDLDLVELKTRQFKSVPSKAQALTHHIQVMLYKKLFDDIITGKLKKDVIVRHLKLKLDREFGDDVKLQVGLQGIDSLTLGDLLDQLFSRMQTIPCISQLLIEYCYQEDKSTIAMTDVPYDEGLLKEQFEHFIKYWKGERQPCGVDIEDAWKCQRCDFADVCEWREKKAEQYSHKNMNKKKSSNTS